MLLVALVATTAFAACGGSDSNDDGGGVTVTGLKVTKTSLTFTKAGGEETISAQSSQQASATSDATWCTVSTGTMSANLKVTPITVKVAAMTTEINDRSATIIVKAGSETTTVTVTQKAGDILTVSQTEYQVGAEGGTVAVKVTSNGDYTVASDAAWLTVGAKGNGEHSFTAAANPAGNRTATVTFTLNKETATVRIVQTAGQQGTITASAADIAKLMYPGWNLGNTMEGLNWKTSTAPLGENYGIETETHWQGTKTTQAVIDFVKSQGFKSVRIPCNWVCGHISNATDYTIDAAWMNRVQEIVDYCIGSGLYVVLNDHYDGGWIENSFGDLSEATVSKNCDVMKKIWTQIANHFRDYDEHLLFAGLNEPSVDNQAKTDILIRYEQAFIDAVRSTGGNNDKRTLVVQGPSTNIDNTVQFYHMPTDTESGHLMLEVHFYDPFGFTHCSFGGDMGEDKAKKGDWNWPLYFWGSDNHVASSSSYIDQNSTWGEESYVKQQMQKMNTNFVSKGIPVLIGEYGCNWRKLASDQDKHDASVKAYHKTVVAESINNGCIPVVWDINAASQNGLHGIMTVINRANLTVFCQFAMDGITEGVAAGNWPY